MYNAVTEKSVVRSHIVKTNTVFVDKCEMSVMSSFN